MSPSAASTSRKPMPTFSEVAWRVSVIMLAGEMFLVSTTMS